MSAPAATLTLVRYTPAAAVFGALHMATQRRPLGREPGLRFARLLGTGGGIGFSARPDLLTWALFAAWESRDAWERFDVASPVMRQYRERGDEAYTVVLAPLSSHGRWDGAEPFGPLAGAPRQADDGAPVAVLTRATIRTARALRFWARVPHVDGTLRDHPDLLASFGFGEVPWLRQGTLSVWRSAAAMRSWAYAQGGPHADVVHRTRAERWYAEELFARFRPLGTRGTLRGADPLAGVLPRV